jgi:LacI family transcriptional regulator
VQLVTRLCRFRGESRAVDVLGVDLQFEAQQPMIVKSEPNRMNDQHDLAEFGRLSPSDMFAALREQANEALELQTRAEAMAERSTRDPLHKRYLIGLISCLLPIPDLAHPVFEKMLLGIRGRMTANDCDVLLCATRTLGADENLRRAAAKQTIERGVDGVIAWGVAFGDPECEPILSSDLPVIFVDNDVLGEHAGSVMSANVEAMATIVNHLYQAGRRRIAHISGHYDTRPGPDRLLGFRSEIERLGLPAPAEYVAEGDFFHDSGFDAAKRLLELDEPPDAIACASDSMAVGAMAAIEQAGLRVPDDIAVTGFDDADYAVTVVPALTTMRQDALGMGTAAAEAVLRMLDKPDSSPPVVLIETELIVRESSGPTVSRKN